MVGKFREMEGRVGEMRFSCADEVSNLSLLQKENDELKDKNAALLKENIDLKAEF